MRTVEAVQDRLETVLASYDIDYGTATQSRGHESWSTIPPQQFFDEAGCMLDDLSGIIMEEAVPNLPELSGRWHPSGFMVYPLGTHPELGTLRLHVWPKELRRMKKRGHGQLYSHRLGLIQDGDIHNHAWDIVSHVYAGYSDDIVNIESMCSATPEYLDDGNQSLLDIYRVHRVNYDPYGVVTLQPHHPDTHNSLYTTAMTKSGGWVILRSIEHRDCEPDDKHMIDAGIFHAPAIPYGRFAATLAWNSHRRIPGPDILLRGPLATVTYDRLKVTPEEAELARSQLLSPPAEKVGLLSPEQAIGIQVLQRVIAESEHYKTRT